MDCRKLLGVGATFLLSLNVNLPAIAQLEQTNVDNSNLIMDVTLKTQEGQTFNQLIQQAEIQAVDLIEQEFATNPKVTEIALTILGDRQGQQVPLLFSRVSRADWQQQPLIRQWTKYFATSAVLLGFNQPQKNPAPQNQPTPSTQNNVPPTPPRPSNLPPAPPIPSNSRPPAPSPNNAPASLGGASLEETDPGYR